MQSPKLVSGPFNHMRQCRHGVMLYNCNDLYIGRSLDLYGEWSEGEIAIFRQIIRPGDIAIDAGPNIGSHTVYLTQALGPQGRVYAFEPQRIVFQTLCANVALNSITNAYCYHAALGSQRGTVNVPALDYSRSNNFGGLSLDINMPGETVEVVTLDSFQLPSCRLLKIDVEGMELNVLQGAVQLIDKCKPCLYVENDRPQHALALTKFIDSLGYQMYWHLPPIYSPENFFQNPQNAFGGTVSANLICVHPSWNLTMQGFQRTYPGERSPLGG